MRVGPTPDFYRWLSLRLAHLVIKVIHLQQGDTRKGTAMQPITIIQ
jgi:hypothetical protein